MRKSSGFGVDVCTLVVTLSLSLSLALALTLLARPAFADTARRDPPLLFGAGPHVVRPPVEIDPQLPTGAGFAARRERPRGLGAACSPRYPLCVQRGPGVSVAQASRALPAFELGYERVVLALRAPAPLGDDGHGGSDALDWYLEAGTGEVTSERDAVGFGALDRAAAFCMSGASDDDLLAERDATLCLGEAIAKRLDPFGGHLTYRKEPDSPGMGSICLTYEFGDYAIAERAAESLRSHGEHIEGPADYGE